jgi:hypothetical protein
MSLSRFVVLVSAAYLSACGQPPARCNTTNCDGCCDQVTDSCVAGTAAPACGAGGKLCIECGTGFSCGSDRACHAITTTTARCNASNCDGCCNSSGQCFGGLAIDQCGASGALCSVCPSGKTCTAISATSSLGGQCR